MIEGERNLSPELAQRFADACGYSGKEALYFCELVAFNQARTSEERQRHYEALSSYRGFRRAHQLDVAHAAYHAQWYIPTIRELAALRGFQPDPEWLAARMLPPITREQASQALDVLFQLGLLVADENGRVSQREAVVSTGPETSGVHIVSYHRAMMQHAIEAIDLVPREQRDISALTLSVSMDALARIKQRIQEFRRELVGIEGADGRAEVVVQLNFQLYPLTQPIAARTEPVR